MAAPKLSDAISSPDKGETWDFHCNYPYGCGDDGVTPGTPGFASTGWPTPQIAKARGAEHYAEHKALEDNAGEILLRQAEGKPYDDLLAPASELAVFREKHGLVSSHEGARAVKK